MSGPSVLPSQVGKLVQEVGYPVLLGTYERTPTFFPQFCRVVPDSATSAPRFGHKQTRMVGPAALKGVKPGQPLPSTDMGEGYTWQIATNKYGREISFPIEVLESPTWRQKIGDAAAALGQEWGELAAVVKDQFVAGVLQYGTIAAGNTDYFDNSFPENADPNRGKIYDGKALFATDHPNIGTSSTYANITASLSLSTTNIDTVFTAMKVTNAKDERGNQALIRPDCLIVPPALERSARVIAESTLLPGTANNDLNTFRGQFSVIANPYLTIDSDAWWTCQRGKGLVAIDSGAPVLETALDGTGQNIVIRVRTYFGCGVEDWRYWYAANKATS
jgi:hypothetical protein